MASATATGRLSAMPMQTPLPCKGQPFASRLCKCATPVAAAHPQPYVASLWTPLAAGRLPQCASCAALPTSQQNSEVVTFQCEQRCHSHDSQQPSTASRVEQQQTYWLPQVHSRLLHSQLNPAQQVHHQLLLHHQQQHQQQLPNTVSSSCTGGSSTKVPSCCTHSDAFGDNGLLRGIPVVAMAAAPAIDVETIELLERSAAASVSSSQEGSTNLRERIRQNLAAKAQQLPVVPVVSSANQKSHELEASDQPTLSSNNSSSSSEVRARLRQQLASRSSTAPSNSNDSNIAAVLQQLQQKLGQKYGGKTQSKQSTTVSDACSPGSKRQVDHARQSAAASTHSSLASEQQLKATSRAGTRQKTSSKQLSPAKPPSPPPQTLVDMLQSRSGLLTCTADKVRTLSSDKQRSRASISQLQAATAAAVTDLQSVVKKTGAPEAVRMRLMWDWQRNPALPAHLGELRQKLIPFEDMAVLLGGEDIAAEILAKDSALMVQEQQQLQARLLHLQQLVESITADAEAAALSKSQPTAATVPSNNGSLAAVRDRLLSRQLSPDPAAPVLPVAATAANNNSSVGVTPEVLSLVRVSPGILLLDHVELQQKLVAVQKALGLSYAQDVLQVLRHQPLLLDVRTQKLEAKTRALADSLELPLKEVGILVRKQPLLLNLSPKSWPSKISRLKEVLALPKQQFLELVTAKPGVLMYNPDKLRAKSLKLQGIAGTHRDWDAEFRRRLSPGSLVQLLTVGEERLLRAEYLVSIGAQHKQSMLYTIQVQKAHSFKEKFPGFDKWHKEWNQHKQAAELGDDV